MCGADECKCRGTRQMSARSKSRPSQPLPEQRATGRREDRRGHGTGVDSCHRVWFELHEDLVATLGIDRATER
jgi:hypothetical protein